ncbi:MAG: twin-arginine translocation signal domain-containing protein, partial [Bacteroidales bacterium]|nr:twin-arginine translocation signal domain-containing protein [Bacteroidales bacterium]
MKISRRQALKSSLIAAAGITMGAGNSHSVEAESMTNFKPVFYDSTYDRIPKKGEELN